MLIKLAWKNIWRNKIRSGVILGAIALGLFAGTYLALFSSGWMVGTVNDVINTDLAHIQLRDTTFAADNDINAYFLRKNIENIFDNFRQKYTLCKTANISYRLLINGMLASANNSVGVQANGVNVEEEKLVSSVWKTIPDSLGKFLPADATNPIVISTKTAEKLKIKLNSKIVFSFQDAVGQMQSMAFRVRGIFHTSNAAFDESTVFVRYSDLQPNTALPDSAFHVAAILFASNTPFEKISEITPEVQKLFPAYEVRNWEQISPMMSLSLSWTNLMVVVIIGIFLFALAFGIINTMLMAVLERTQELGMLGAIGMSKGKIFTMIMYETIFLTILGGFIGIILAALALFPSIHSGIDLTPLMGNTFENFGFSSVVYPILDIKMFLEIVSLVIITGIISAIYPARKALKLKPLDAIRE
ncbi:MAG: FtsX-like permease family protein [Paludibacter sp.]|nr:FtsX-like permease family protein [Paludibacter sp.]